MELKRFLVLSAVLALAFTMANPAHAQFGNLLNKTKKAVEKKVKKTAKSAAEKAGVPIEDSSISGDDGSGLTTLYNYLLISLQMMRVFLKASQNHTSRSMRPTSVSILPTFPCNLIINTPALMLWVVIV